ncbi:hypothetical protein K7432_011671 [Basidiobolus ranarum]|uniref:Uncharacterized protein n=1 Tax=Basidiobolus ranarum TaxID=34480 RepID=A0ABR2WLY4_9FUNG
MKRLFSTLVLISMNFLQVKSTSNRFSIGNIEDTFGNIIGSSNGNILGSIFSKDGFASDIIHPSKQCQDGILQALLKYTSLHECYQLPLIFATLDTVCSPKCLPDTVLGSKIINDSCYDEITEDEENVFRNWSNENAAKSACSLDSNGTRCLSKLLTASVTVMNLKFRPGNDATPQEYQKALCNNCLKTLFESVDSPSDIPTLYMYKLLDPDEFFALGVEYCDWKQPVQS